MKLRHRLCKISTAFSGLNVTIKVVVVFGEVTLIDVLKVVGAELLKDVTGTLDEPVSQAAKNSNVSKTKGSFFIF
jgi:hypothetical protein